MKSRIFFPVIILMIFSGCWFVRVGFEHIDDAVFKTPARIPNKITAPVKDSVLLSALWVGHSTVLLQIDDKVILIDPLFEDVIAGIVLRKIEAGLDIESIPRLDAILISHAHMDHLSFQSLEKLDKKFPNTSLIFPEGVEQYIPGYKMKMIRLKTGNSEKRQYTGETINIAGLKVTSVFAEHQGGRFGLDSYTWNVPGFTGYIIEYRGITVYYAGDTIYEENAFKEIGNKFRIDLALIPIGPCRNCEEVNGSTYHVSSFGALKMLDDLKAEHMIPVHYGAITYFNDPDIPVIVLRDLIKGLDNKSVNGADLNIPYSEKVKILDEGEQYIFKYK